MLQEYKIEGQGAWTPRGVLGEDGTICFSCEDALSVYGKVVRQGLKAARPFVGSSMWVTSLTDPDGYRLDFES